MQLYKTGVFLYGLAGVLALSACNKEEEDTSAPQVSILNINQQTEDIRVAAGEDMRIAIEAKDNEALNEVKYEIHNLFDSHSHGKQNPWSALRIVSLSGPSATDEQLFTVDAGSTAGRYHAVVRALDAAGNASGFAEKDFVVTNGTEPMFNVTQPDFSQEVHAPKGSTLQLGGNISDNNDIAEILVLLVSEDDPTVGEIYEADIDVPGTSDQSYDLSQIQISIPQNAPMGYYHLEIVAKDNEGNYGIFDAEVHVM